MLTHRSASRTITQGRESPHLHAACRSRAGCVRCGSAQILSSMDQCINSPVETSNYIWEEAGGAAGGRDSDVWCSYPNLILAPILCYGIINELTILIITTVEVKICYSWNVDLIGSVVRRCGGGVCLLLCCHKMLWSPRLIWDSGPRTAY